MTPIALLLPLLPLLPLTTATPICTPTTPAILPCTTPTIWTLTNITYTSTAIYSTPAHLATAYASFSFSLSSNAVPYTYTCSAGSSSYPTYFNGDQAYTCTASNGDATAQATWTWNAGTKEVYFNANWVCVDGCLA
ncbi:hypothetical protein GLAREA_11926 [Glarea lozoyensis ATCC 20868]|uniref:AA1-like domain-containing protein n=1 Tax=Glarea lozoyensis (strain ATCC 20868 / MF5171) TaxID=1116229 RepID=S3D406_GLAL2|nr:uncharacterized protein GLAREA_11926 [Glarea lozoyensis ATCC 20868]EPE31844.1 hypothetical protein GLAREA_11926 [Glarea lozoyensis ATCC 20868]